MSQTRTRSLSAPGRLFGYLRRLICIRRHSNPWFVPRGPLTRESMEFQFNSDLLILIVLRLKLPIASAGDISFAYGSQSMAKVVPSSTRGHLLSFFFYDSLKFEKKNWRCCTLQEMQISKRSMPIWLRTPHRSQILSTHTKDDIHQQKKHKYST